MIKHRQINEKTVDDQSLLALCTHEIARLTVLEPAPLGFILPSVTIVASTVDEEEFMRQARMNLNEWHRWLHSVFYKTGNVRRWKRQLDAVTYEALIKGVFILHGQIQNFRKYEKAFERKSGRVHESNASARKRCYKRNQASR
jgi:hypothetical protein